MAGKNQGLTLLILLIIFCVTNSSKLNVPRVLLPLFSTSSTNFTLEVTEGGCYKWSTSRLDIVQLYPLDVDLDNGCSAKVVVSTISKEAIRNTAIVLAEEIHSGQILRCDVIVDVIASLDILTTTRELFMKEAPEAFEVCAYDDQGNTFSTLEGIEFQWSLGSSGKGKGNNVLRFITFRDSPYETPASIQDFDERGLQGHIVLLEGIKTGSAKVTVKLPHFEYRHIHPVEVALMVVANLILDPPDVYVLRGSVIKFKVLQVHHGRIEEIQLPNPQYYLEAENMDVVNVHDKTGSVTGISLGKTRVLLHDRDVDETESGIKLPTANIYVTTAAYLTIAILPHRNWAILEGDHHAIVVEVFASNDHKIHINEGVEVHTQIDPVHFNIEELSANGTWLSGTALEAGTVPVHASLEALVSPQLGRLTIEPKVTANAEMFIYPRVLIIPGEVVMPWDPIVRPKYEVQLKAMGGDGNFLWSSSNVALGVVTQSGLVKTHGHGSLHITAAMARNHHNKAVSQFRILPPTKLEINEYIMESEVGTPVFLHVALYAEREDGTQVPFTKCRSLPFIVDTSDSNFYYNESAVVEPVGLSCSTVAVVGREVGTSRITVSYSTEGVRLEDSVTVSTYRPLTVINPASKQTVLAVGTSRKIIFSGGPRPWLGRPSEHSRQVVSEKAFVESVDVSEDFKVPGEQNNYVINVLCRELGESIVTLSVSNRPLLPNCKFSENIANVKVICGKPRLIHLALLTQITDSKSCPMDLNAERVVVQSYRDIELNVVVKDDQGRKFDNISSLQIEWKTNPFELGKTGHPVNAFTRNITEGNVVLQKEAYQTVTPTRQSGILDVFAKVTGYRNEILHFYKITPEWPEFLDEDEKGMKPPIITTKISLILVDDANVSPRFITLYNHPSNRISMEVRQGSGYYELGLSSVDIVDVKYSEGNRELLLLPINDGELTLNLIDLCLVSKPVTIIVNVVSVKSIKVDMADRVEIGRCIKCIVKLYDESDSLLPVPDIQLLNLHPVIESNIINVKLAKEDPIDPWPVGEMHFIVTGLELGDTKLTFTAGRVDHELRSTPLNVQVFSPLKIFPRNTTLIISSSLQLISKGGPHPDSNVEYYTNYTDIIDVNPNGLIEGLKVGHTRVTGRAIGVNPSTGQRVIYSQDTVDVHVVPLIGIKIRVPLTRFKVGTVIPAWAVSIPDQITPTILGSTNPPIRFDWYLSNNDIINLSGVFDETGIIYEPADQLSVRLRGEKAGRVTLHLNVTFDSALCSAKAKKPTIVYTTALELEVFEGLRLMSPSHHDTDELLLAPETSLQLNTNRDALSRVTYAIQSETSLDQSCSQSSERSLSLPNTIITVSENGLLRSNSVFGRAVILITAIEEFGLKQTISVVVQVKPVHYMMLNVRSKLRIKPGETLSALPHGLNLNLVVSYHDNTGTVFTAARSDVRLRTSRHDLVSVNRGVDNTSLIVSMMKTGDAVLKVWDDGLTLRMFDYVKLHIDNIISPFVNVLTVGDIVCHTVSLMTETDEHGSWSTSNSNALKIYPESGLAIAVKHKERTVTITHTLGASLTTAIDVNILSIDQINFMLTQDDILSNLFASHKFSVPIVFNAFNSSKSSNLVNDEISRRCIKDLENQALPYPFSCQIKFLNSNVTMDALSIFSVFPHFNWETGHYSCDIITLNDPTVATSMLDTDLMLSVNVGQMTAQKQIKFVPAVHIEKRDLYFDNRRFRASVVLHGLKKVLNGVMVKPFDDDLLAISNPSHPSSTSKKFDVKLINYYWNSGSISDCLSIIITSDLAKQSVKVPIKTDITQKGLTDSTCNVQAGTFWSSPLVDLFWDYRQMITIILSLAIICFLIPLGYSFFMNPVINVNMSPNRPYLSPYGNPHSAMYAAYPQNLSGTGKSPNLNTSLNQSFNTSSSGTPPPGGRDPIYGDPSSLTSSDLLRRNRRFV